MDVRRENMAMAAIIDIRPHLDVKRTKSDAQKPSASATILLFNGVRYETLVAENADGAKASLDRKVGRARKSR
ncbi:MAG: hypothetical protein AAF940_13890 [Pseudomonadota bacterium]